MQPQRFNAVPSGPLMLPPHQFPAQPISVATPSHGPGGPSSTSNNAQLTTLDQCLLRQVLLKLSDLDLEALLRTLGQEHPNIAKRLAVELKLQRPAANRTAAAPPRR